MHYVEIEQAKELAELNKTLSLKLEKRLKHTETRTIGSPGGSFSTRVRFLSSQGQNVFWWAGRRSKDRSAALNLFGHGVPGSSKPLLIDVQFNIPVGRFSKRRAGVFIREISSNKIVLAHRGIVASGHRHIRKDVLFQEMHITLLEAQTSSGPDELIPVEDLASSQLIDSIDNFSRQLREVVRSMKDGGKRTVAVKVGTLPARLRSYFDEFSGRRVLKSRKQTTAQWHHGNVVGALRDAIRNSGKEPLKSREVDLVAFGKKKVFLFEVKTHADTQSVYTAIGQLMVHSSAVAKISGKPLVKVVVLPELPSPRLYHAVTSKLNVKVLTFARSAKGVFKIQGLRKLE